MRIVISGGAGFIGSHLCERYLAEGHFAAGSMGPKIEAAIHFLAQSTDPAATALITNPENLLPALDGATGTRIVRGDG